jgi:hypothetical protein
MNTTLQAKNDPKHPDFAYKINNSGLQSLLSIRNLTNSVEKHMEQLTKIESDMGLIYNNSLTLFQTYNAEGDHEHWENALSDINDGLTSVIESINSAVENIGSKNTTDHSELWNTFDIRLQKMKQAFKKLEIIGKEQLTEKDQSEFAKYFSHYESNLLPFITSYAGMCKAELQMIERFTQTERDEIAQLILSHIPENFTHKEAEKYETEYMNALELFRKEFSQKKNLWDTFLDILAGNTHQSPSEKVMLMRWIEGNRGDL